MHQGNTFFRKVGVGMFVVLMNMISFSAIPVHGDKKEDGQGMSQSAQAMKKKEKKEQKALVAACMQKATDKKKTALKVADEAWKMAREKSKETTDKKAGQKIARDTHKKALKSVQAEFQKDQRACKKAKTSEKKENELKVTLASQNNSGESGTATLKEEDGKVKVTLELTGAPADVSQPAHIHMGSCAALGGVSFSLTDVLNGKSQITLDTTLAVFKTPVPLAINVHKSSAEAGVYVSCGDVKF